MANCKQIISKRNHQWACRSKRDASPGLCQPSANVLHCPTVPTPAIQQHCQCAPLPHSANTSHPTAHSQTPTHLLKTVPIRLYNSIFYFKWVLLLNHKQGEGLVVHQTDSGTSSGADSEQPNTSTPLPDRTYCTI